jgi:endonuclease/exonuclease/phosphatase family metal-dependent hydrolase
MPRKSTPIQVVNWNVNRRGASALDALKGLVEPDVLTLQEVTFNQRKRREFEERLAKMGLKCCPDSQRHTRGKDYGNLIASRWSWRIEPIEPRYSRDEPPWRELLVQASVSVDGRSFLVINVHIPNGSNYGWKKIDTFNALKDVVRKAKGRPCIVSGDFNEPDLIPLQDGAQFIPPQDGLRIVTWGQWWDAQQRRYVCTGTSKDRNGRSRANEEWDAAVRWLFEKEDEHGMRHAYWEAHVRGAMPVSFVTNPNGQPRWFDHMFVSRHFHVEQCKYLHELRYGRHSDHSALEAKLLLEV